MEILWNFSNSQISLDFGTEIVEFVRKLFPKNQTKVREKRLKSKNQKKSFLTRSQKKPSQEDFVIESERKVRVLDKLVNAECAVVPQICLRGYFTTEASWMDIDVDPLTERSESCQRKLVLVSRIVLSCCSSHLVFSLAIPRNSHFNYAGVG